MIGLGTVVNTATVLVGSGIGLAVGSRLPARVKNVVTDGLGLVTLLIAALSAVDVTSPALRSAVGSGAPLLIVLGAVLLGGIIGSALDLDARLVRLGAVIERGLRRRSRADPTATEDVTDDAGPDPSQAASDRFVAGFVAASLVFCTGPLTILGSLNDGLGNGADQLYLKATLDGFAAIAFAATFGWGVAASAVTVIVVQGALTLLGWALGDVLPEAHVAALSAVGGVLLIGVALRLLRIREIAVVSLLPALIIAPLLVELVVRVRT